MHHNDASDADDAPDRWFLEPFTSRDVARVATATRAARTAILEAASKETALAIMRYAIECAVRDGTIAARFGAFITIDGLERRAKTIGESGSVKGADVFDRAEIDDVEKALFLNMQSGDDIKEVFDVARRIYLLDTNGSLKSALELVDKFETYVRSKDSKVVGAAVWCGAWSAIQNEALRRSEWTQIIVKLFEMISRLCLSHRSGDIRACAAMQCGELAIVAMSRSLDVHESFARGMLQLSLDEKVKVRNAVSCSVARFFVRRIVSGTFTVRDADAALLCAMFVSALGKRNPFAHIDYVNKAHLVKTMNEGCASVTYYVLEHIVECMTSDQLWFTDDKDICGRRLRACALIVEHVGNRIAPFIDSIIKILIDTLNKSFVERDAQYFIEILMEHAPSTRGTWVESMTPHLESASSFAAQQLALWVCDVFLFLTMQHGVTDVLKIDDIAFIVSRCHFTKWDVIGKDGHDLGKDLDAQIGKVGIFNVVSRILASCSEIVSHRHDPGMRKDLALIETNLKFERIHLLASKDVSVIEEMSSGQIPQVLQSCAPVDEVEAAVIFRRILDATNKDIETRQNALSVLFVLLPDMQLLAEIKELVAARIDPTTYDGSFDSLVTINDSLIPFVLYVRSRTDQTLVNSDFVANITPALDFVLDWMRWRPGESTARLADTAAMCFVVERPMTQRGLPITHMIENFSLSLKDEPTREKALETLLTRWLSQNNRSQRAIDVICSMSLENSSHKPEAMMRLQKCACLADGQNAVKFLERVASRYLDQVSLSSCRSVRIFSLIALGKTIEELACKFNRHATAEKLAKGLFLFTDDTEGIVRKAAVQALASLKRCHTRGTKIVRELLNSVGDFIHKDFTELL